MALITKKYLSEQVLQLLSGGDPSVGKKYETRMVYSFLQQAVNRKLKTEYLSVTLPGDETVPEGLVLACYDRIPVTAYKGVLSRAKLPAMPVSLRRGMGVFFVGPSVVTAEKSIAIQSAEVELSEGDSSAVVFPFTVTRTGGADGEVVIAWVVTGYGENPAVAADFTGGVLPSGVITFADEDATETINVSVAGDYDYEEAKEFLVTITVISPVTLEVTNATCIGRILNNDTAYFDNTFDQSFN